MINQFRIKIPNSFLKFSNQSRFTMGFVVSQLSLIRDLHPLPTLRKQFHPLPLAIHRRKKKREKF